MPALASEVPSSDLAQRVRDAEGAYWTACDVYRREMTNETYQAKIRLRRHLAVLYEERAATSSSNAR